MADDKELEIRLQFIDEAQEYLNTLEARLMGVAQGFDGETINDALRAAHSIKGGAALMGFQTLSNLAHRLEDGLKVLKVQRGKITVDASLEQALLTAVDFMTQVMKQNSHYLSQGDSSVISEDQTWLQQQVEPLFRQIHERLGEPQEEDAHSMLSPEDNQEIIPLLFQSEVEGCLQRLESVLNESSPCLREEVQILAQELGGLAEMLQLDAYGRLCQGIETQIMKVPDTELPATAKAALDHWRQAQDLVLSGNLTAIPDHFLESEAAAVDSVTAPLVDETTLDIAPAGTSETAPTGTDEAPLVAWPEADELDFTAPLDPTETWPVAAIGRGDASANPDSLTDTLASDSPTDSPTEATDIPDETPTVEILDIAVPAKREPLTAETANPFNLEVFESSSLAEDDLSEDELDPAESLLADTFAFESGNLESGGSDPFAPDHAGGELAATSAAATAEAEAWMPTPPPPGTTFQPEPEPEPAPDSTVRVPVKQINQFSDMFGELIIERNRLELEVKRLRQMVATMQGRMRTLEQVNSDLRNVYDRVATQGDTLRQSGTLQWEAAQGITATPEEETLSNEFDVLELDRYRDTHLPFREIIETIVQLQEVGDDIDLSLDQTEQTTRSLRKTSRQLQKYLTQLRMRPLSDIFDRFPRALRQMSLQYDKPVELKLEGQRTLVDRNVLESLQEPLMHIIRNCFDHGIEDKETRRHWGKPETGSIAISAYQRSGRTVITISDDGGGIPMDKIRDRALKMGLDETLLAAASKQDLLALIFEPGFSTASQVTNLSGRGVGMDVVRSKLKEIRGDIQVDTETGVGTVFTLSIPFTLSVTRVLIVESRGMRMAFPVDIVVEMFVLDKEQILSTAGKDSFEWNGELLQLVKLSNWLHFNCPVTLDTSEITPAISAPTVLLVQYNQRLVGIQVERSWGEQEVALRRVVGNLPMPVGFNSCTILGDGRVVPLVSVPELLYWIASCEAAGTTTAAELALTAQPSNIGTVEADTAVSRRPTVLLIDDSINVRRFMALTLEKAGYQVAQAKDGQDALDKLAAGLTVDAVICDVEMPRLDGYGFLAQLKAKGTHEHLPVAMLTSRSSQKHRQMAMKLGASAYFTKPYNEQTLLQTLEDLIQPALVH